MLGFLLIGMIITPTFMALFAYIVVGILSHKE